MKFLLILTIFFGLNLLANSQNINITSLYEGPFDDVLNESKRLKKPIFLDFTSVTCKHCIKMEKEILANPKIAENLNNNFIGYKVDLDDTEGKQIAKKYNITEFPSYTILDASQRNLGTIQGFYMANQFIKEINKLMAADQSKPISKPKRRLFR